MIAYVRICSMQFCFYEQTQEKLEEETHLKSLMYEFIVEKNLKEEYEKQYSGEKPVGKDNPIIETGVKIS